MRSPSYAETVKRIVKRQQYIAKISRPVHCMKLCSSFSTKALRHEHINRLYMASILWESARAFYQESNI